MPLILLLPLFLPLLLALAVLLMPLSMVQRYRRGRARRRVQPWVVSANAWLLAVSVLVFLAAAAAIGYWVADALRDAAVGLLVGILVGMAGLKLDRFEIQPEGLFRTPNRWLVLGLSLLLVLRIVLGIWLAWGDAQADTGAVALITRGGLLAVGGVLLGFALATAWGLRARVSRLRR